MTADSSSRQRFAFGDDAELVLVTPPHDDDGIPDDDSVWIDMELTNFTGRLMVRRRSPRKESDDDNDAAAGTIPASSPPSTTAMPTDDEEEETKTTAADTGVATTTSDPPTPVHRNSSTLFVDDGDDDDIEQEGRCYGPADSSLPPPPPSLDISAQGFAVADNASLLSLPAIEEMSSQERRNADDDEDSLAEQVRRFVAQVDDPNRQQEDEEDTVQFTSDAEGSSSSDDQRRGGSRQKATSVRHDGNNEASGRGESLGSFTTTDGSDADIMGTSQHSESGGSDSWEGPTTRGRAGRRRRGLSKKRRASSLGPGGGLGQRASSPSLTDSGERGPNKEFFNRAVSLLKKRGEGNKRTSSKELASSGEQGSSGRLDKGGDDDENDKTLGATNNKKAYAPSWGKVMQVYSAKKHVPATIRQKRIEERRASMSQSLGRDPSKSLFPSRLHELCAEPDATLAELIECLENNKEAVALKDETGKLPLHILGDNEGLVSSSQGKQVASAFAWKLMEADPEAMVVLDKHGHMPFVTLIADWVTWVYENHKKLRKAKQAVSPGLFLRGTNNSDQINTNRDANNAAFFARKTGDYTSTTRLFPKPEVWDEVEWCFSMLSLAVDELAGKSGVLFKTTRRDVFASHHTTTQPKVKKPDAMRREIVCHLIQVLPSLLKTVLLIESEGGETRRRILKMSIFRRMFLCKECIGDWLTQMLRKTGSASRRAVDFLELVSDTTVRDYTGGHRATLVEDAQKFHEEREEVFDAVNCLEGTIGSLVTMENRQIERAAATGVIWHIMGERLARPFVLGLVLVDLVLHISLMVAFRNNVQIQESTIEISNQSVLFICSHYLIRKGCEALALLSISPSIFRGYFMNVWTLFDLMAIILTMTAFVWNSKNPGSYRNGFNAFVVGLLWMKVVGFLKVVNKDMSTFILALLEILHDIKYFLVVLVVVIFMFGDMFHLAVSTKDDGAFCDLDDLEGPTRDFCNGQLTKSYLRVYSILLGDFELNDLQDSTGITTIYVIFTSLGVVILLNVLIAVIADSYEKATVSSAMLFGRARVTFVAQNEALEAFLKPGVNPLRAFRGTVTNRTLLSRLFTIFRWFVLLGIIATAGDTALFLLILGYDNLFAQGNRDPTFVTASLLVVLFLVLIAALGVLVGFAFEGLVNRLCPGPLNGLFERINRICVSSVRWLAFRLFGLHSRKQNDPGRTTNADDWTGRLNYMENTFERIVQDAKKELSAEMVALETRLYEHDFATGQTLNQSDTSPGKAASVRNLMTFPMRRS